MIVNYHLRFVVTNNSKVANYNRKEFIRFATEAKRKMFLSKTKFSSINFLTAFNDFCLLSKCLISFFFNFSLFSSLSRLEYFQFLWQRTLQGDRRRLLNFCLENNKKIGIKNSKLNKYLNCRFFFLTLENLSILGLFLR